MKIMDNSLKPSQAYHKSTPFMMSEDEYGTQEGPGKSMKNVLHILRCDKRHILGQSDIQQ